jgi:hypothetical protein
MTHLVEQLRDEAETNIAAMRAAALRARDTHARAELMRHMLMFHSYVNAPTDAHDGAVRATCASLENAFAKAGMPLADQMAWRSICAHGWWAQVRPAPPGRGRPDRDWPAKPLWDHGCLPECR